MDTIWDCPQTELYSFILEGGVGEKEKEGREKRRVEGGREGRGEERRKKGL